MGLAASTPEINTSCKGIVQVERTDPLKSGQEPFAKLEVHTAQCIHKDWFNHLDFSFYAHDFETPDLQAAARGDSVSESAESYRKINKPPYISVGVTLRPPTEDDATSDLIYGMIPGRASITAVWILGEGKHNSRTVQLPPRDASEEFKLTLVSSNEISIVWKASHYKEMKWSLEATALICVRPEHGAVRWQKDNDSNRCMNCTEPFTVFVRRHHCRECGYLHCNTCTSHANNKGERVCERCKK
jgi:hypothetical protein